MYSKTSPRGGIMVTFPCFFTKSARKSTEFWKNYQTHGHFFFIYYRKRSEKGASTGPSGKEERRGWRFESPEP